jgi:hypothetical protein
MIVRAHRKHYDRGFGDAFNDRPADASYGIKTALYSHNYAAMVQAEYGRGFAAGQIERVQAEKRAQVSAAERLSRPRDRLL